MVIRLSAIAVGLAATTLLVDAAVTGCGNTKSASPSSSPSASASSASSSPAPPSDYSNLLIKPTDIAVPGDTFTLVQMLPLSAPPGVTGAATGVTGLFANQAQ